jgi:hypothetical protein
MKTLAAVKDLHDNKDSRHKCPDWGNILYNKDCLLGDGNLDHE